MRAATYVKAREWESTLEAFIAEDALIPGAPARTFKEILVPVSVSGVTIRPRAMVLAETSAPVRPPQRITAQTVSLVQMFSQIYPIFSDLHVASSYNLSTAVWNHLACMSMIYY